MEFNLSVPTVISIIAVLISASATYNAYMLRGGKLASSQILMALGMISILLSVVIGRFSPDLLLWQNVAPSDLLFVIGFILLLVASVKLRGSFS